MIVQFINRQQELETLDSLFAKKKAALLLLYGRRRVGETRLIQEFLRKGLSPRTMPEIRK